MFKLLIEDDEGNTSVVPLIRDEITIGRQEGNTIRLTEQNVSRRHARIVREGKKLFLESVEARYGTRKNGKRITKRVPISEGDEISIGDYRLCLKAEEKPSATSEAQTIKTLSSDVAAMMGDEQIVNDHPTERLSGKEIAEGIEAVANTDRMTNTDVIEAASAPVASTIKLKADELPDFDDEFSLESIAPEDSDADTSAEDSEEVPDEDLAATIPRLKLSSDARKQVQQSSPELPTDERDTIPSGQVNGPKRPETPAQSAAVEHAKLVITSGSLAGQSFELKRRDTLIGRGDDCHILVDHRSVSLHHAKIIRESEDLFKVVDLESKNGLRVNGEEYRTTHLKRGDTVELGYVKMRFVEPGEDYVFTPEVRVDKAVLRPQARKSPQLPVLVGGIFGVLLLLAVGAFFITKSETPPAQETAIAQASTESITHEQQPGTNSPDVERVQAAIDRAKDEHIAGQTERAIGTLEFALEFLEPTGDQSNEIQRLLATFSGKEAPDEAPNEQAGAAKEAESDELADATASASPQGSAAAIARPMGAARHANSGMNSKSNFQQQIHAAAARELFSSAQRKLIQKDANGAIEDCLSGLEKGHLACHRILGFAYREQNDSRKACEHFKEYLKTNPTNVGDVLREMETMKCSL